MEEQELGRLAGVPFAGGPVLAAPLWPTNTVGLPIGVQRIALPGAQTWHCAQAGCWNRPV